MAFLRRELRSGVCVKLDPTNPTRAADAGTIDDQAMISAQLPPDTADFLAIDPEEGSS